VPSSTPAYRKPPQMTAYKIAGQQAAEVGQDFAASLFPFILYPSDQEEVAVDCGQGNTTWWT
jgi:hypothetical protein